MPAVERTKLEPVAKCTKCGREFLTWGENKDRDPYGDPHWKPDRSNGEKQQDRPICGGLVVEITSN